MWTPRLACHERGGYGPHVAGAAAAICGLRPFTVDYLFLSCTSRIAFRMVQLPTHLADKDAATRESYTTQMPQADSLELVPLRFAFRCDRHLRVDQSWVQVTRYDAVAARSVDARELVRYDVARAWRMLGIWRKRQVHQTHRKFSGDYCHRSVGHPVAVVIFGWRRPHRREQGECRHVIAADLEHYPVGEPFLGPKVDCYQYR